MILASLISSAAQPTRVCLILVVCVAELIGLVVDNVFGHAKNLLYELNRVIDDRVRSRGGSLHNAES